MEVLDEVLNEVLNEVLSEVSNKILIEVGLLLRYRYPPGFLTIPDSGVTIRHIS